MPIVNGVSDLWISTATNNATTTGIAVWQEWQRNWTATSTATTVNVTGSTYPMVTWGNWNTAYTETAESARRRVMQDLIGTARATGRVHGQYYTPDGYVAMVQSQVADLTAAELREIEDGFQRGREERLEDERVRVEGEHQRAEATRRAEHLLVSLLSHEQKQEWLAHRRVTERAPSGRVWRLFPSWSGGAALMAGEVRRATLCVHPRERVPEADAMVALLVALRGGDENHLLTIAILHAGDWSEEELWIRAGRQVRREYANYGEVRGMIEVPAA